MGYKSTKFSLTADEVSLLSDTGFFTRKRQLSERYMDFLGTLEQELNTEIAPFSDRLPVTIRNKRGKISRGENYMGLPYIILDHPAVFAKDGVFAFRTMLWWGHPFSFTFHLSGIYLARYLDSMMEFLQQQHTGLLVCINPGQWEHHHESTNYLSVTEAAINREYFAERDFMKLSATLPLQSSHLLKETTLQFVMRIIKSLR